MVRPDFSSSTPRSLCHPYTALNMDISSFFLVLSLFHQSIVLFDALSSELFQDIVKVSRVGEAVARQVGAKLGLMVDLEDKERMSSFVRGIGN